MNCNGVFGLGKNRGRVMCLAFHWEGENVPSASCRENLFSCHKEGKQHFYVWIEEISLFSPMS